MSSTVYMGWPNRVGESTLSGGSWLAALPRDNMKDARITKVARSSTAALADTKVLGDMGIARSIRGFALVNHNLSQSALVRFRLGTTSGGAEVYDSGWVSAWRMTFDTDLLEWEEPGWWEGIADDEYLRAPFAVVHIAPSFLTARYWSIEINDTTNTNGYVQIGRPFVGGGLVPSRNFSFGYVDGWEDLSSVTRGDNGAEYAVVRPRLRVSRFALEWLTSAEAEYVHEMKRRLGTTGEMLFVPDTSDVDAQQRYGFLGRMRTLSPIEYPFMSIRKSAFEVAEILS